MGTNVPTTADHLPQAMRAVIYAAQDPRAQLLGEGRGQLEHDPNAYRKLAGAVPLIGRYPVALQTVPIRLSAAAITDLAEYGLMLCDRAHECEFMDGARGGDVCTCPDDRCSGHHHEEGEDGGCFEVLLSMHACQALTD